MAIARDGVAASTGSASGFTLTVAHDCGSGTNRFLVIALHSAEDDVTGVTYNSVVMTLLKKTTSGAVGKSQLWGLADPTTGTNDIVVTSSGFHYMGLVAKCYTGVDEPTTPDSVSGDTDSGIGVRSFSMSTTTVADNAWGFFGVLVANTASSPSAGTGSNVVGQYLNATYGSISLFDSNGPKTPAGAYSMEATHGSSTNFYCHEISLAPETGGAAPPPSNMIILFG